MMLYDVLACSPQGGGGLDKRTMASSSSSVRKRAALPALTLKPDSSVPLNVSLTPGELLSQHWSAERVSPSASKSILGPFNGEGLGTPAALISLSHNLLVFTARSCGNFSPRHWSPELGSQVWGLDPLAPLRDIPQPRHLSRFLTATCGYGTIPFQISALPTTLSTASMCP